jgi:hypothetical protein
VFDPRLTSRDPSIHHIEPASPSAPALADSGSPNPVGAALAIDDRLRPLMTPTPSIRPWPDFGEPCPPPLRRPPRMASHPELQDAGPSIAPPVEEMSGVSEPVDAGGMEGAGSAPPQDRRARLHAQYLAAIRRPLDTGHALAAIQLRCAAEIHCRKNNLARFVPRLPKTAAARQRFQDLLAKPVDQLIAEIEAHPHRFSRTQLTDLAQHHLLSALNIDVALYEQGVRQAALYEGLHSVAGRVVSAVAAGVTAGMSELPGISRAVAKGIGILAHEAPPNVVNPALTGGLRSITDVKEAFKRVGGLPVVASQIERSPDMGTILESARRKRQVLDEATSHFLRAHERDPEALDRLVEAFLALHDVADRQYRRRIGLNRTQTYSKGWGMAVNGVAAAGAVVSATVPVVGHVAGLAILAATVPLQWGAGYLDERRNKHRYNLRANTKWADFLTPEAGRVHYKDLRPEHVSESALRRSFMTQPEVQVAAIQEVYEDALGRLVRKHAKLGRTLHAPQPAGTPARALDPRRTALSDLEQRIAAAKRQAADFESFELDRWRAIPADSVIGRCLDDLQALEAANRRARLRKPGEGAQIVQRYAQALHAGVSVGTTLPIVDTIGAIDAFHLHDAHGGAAGLQPGPQAAAAAVGSLGAGVFTAATGEVRMSKADNKKVMSRLRIAPEAYAAHAEDWVFQAAGRTVDLRATAGYRRHVHSRRDEFALAGQALKHGVISGPVGLKNLIAAKAALRHARASLRAALDALAASGMARDAGSPPRRAPTISAMKDALYDYPPVRRCLGAEDARADPAA